SGVVMPVTTDAWKSLLGCHTIAKEARPFISGKRTTRNTGAWIWAGGPPFCFLSFTGVRRDSDELSFMLRIHDPRMGGITATAHLCNEMVGASRAHPFLRAQIQNALSAKDGASYPSPPHVSN